MARTLHIVGMALAMLSGCFLPPSLSVDTQDAQTDSPPEILAISLMGQPVAENSTIDFTQNEASVMTATLIDTDLADTLYVDVFVNYQENPNPARVTCIAGPGASSQRTASCNMMPLCQHNDVGQIEDMTVVVFDREPLQAGTPPYQGTNGGLSTQWFFRLECLAP